MIQKYINFHYSVSLDLFGSETSTNAANYFTAGLKGRWQEERRKDDHVLTEDAGARRRRSRDGEITTDEVPALLALNHDLRSEYIADCQSGLKRWNRVLEKPASTRGCPCRTSASTGRSGCSPGTTSRPTGELVGRGRVGGARSDAGCPPRPTRPTCAR